MRSRPSPPPRPPRPRLAAVVALLGGLLCLVLAALVFSAVPGSPTDERAYAAARPCTPASRPADPDCVREVPYTVVGVHITHGPRASNNRLDLADPADGRTGLRFTGDSPVLSHLRAGEQVTAHVWRGVITAVSRQGLTQATTDAPHGDPLYSIAMGLLLAAAGAYGLWCTWWLLRHAEAYLAGDSRPLAVAGWVLVRAAAVSLLAVVVLVLLSAPFWLQACLVAASLGLAWKWPAPRTRPRPGRRPRPRS